jgi:predicted choloylglycine hydrolase
MIEYPLRVEAVTEDVPGERWAARLREMWPAYRDWYLHPDGTTRPDRDTVARMLGKHMPELEPTYRRLVELAEQALGPKEAATAERMLGLWNPPRFLPGCSQLAVSTPAGPVLCRNYDYAPDLLEGVLWSSRLDGRRVMGMSDCLWGLLDGMNDAGLVVSLTFGGRPGGGEGFAIPLVVRYLLEVARSTAEACAILRRLPVSMSHNLTIIDAEGRGATAYLSHHDRPEFSAVPLATNHQGELSEDPAHLRGLRSVERRESLVELAATEPDRADLVSAFLTDPLYSTGYARAFGTLYTALYEPRRGAVELHWPGLAWRRGFEDPDGEVRVTLRDPGRILTR